MLVDYFKGQPHHGAAREARLSLTGYKFDPTKKKKVLPGNTNLARNKTDESRSMQLTFSPKL